MSKMQCTCGKIISDVEYPCKTEGYLIGQKSWDYVYDEIAVEISKYIDSIQSGSIETWLSSNFNEGYPRDLSNENIISDLITAKLMEHEASVAECEKCGRLWIQNEPGKNEFTAYSPDNGTFNRTCDKVKT